MQRLALSASLEAEGASEVSGFSISISTLGRRPVGGGAAVGPQDLFSISKRPDGSGTPPSSMRHPGM